MVSPIHTIEMDGGILPAALEVGLLRCRNTLISADHCVRNLSRSREANHYMDFSLAGTAIDGSKFNASMARYNHFHQRFPETRKLFNLFLLGK